MSATRAQILLEEFAEAVAAAGPHPGAVKQNGHFYYVYCPFPGPKTDPHQAKGGPRVYLWCSGGDVQAHCDKCLGPKDTLAPDVLNEARRVYTDDLKELINWRHDPPKPQSKAKVLRTHAYYDRDLRHIVLKDKVQGGKFWWRAAPLKADQTVAGQDQPITAEEFLKSHYPEYERLYAALHWYGVENLEPDESSDLRLGRLALRRPRTVIICEGERDCDSFNALMAEIGAAHFATCLAHPKPGKLSAHHLPLLTGAPVVIIPDQDGAGRAAADHWARLVWDHARHVKSVTEQLGLSGRPDDKDLTDWIARRGGPSPTVANELLGIMAAIAPLIDPPQTLADHDCTDDGLALQLGAAWRDQARYVAAWGRWMLWRDGLWHRDEKREHLTRASAFLRQIARNTDNLKLANGLRTKGTVVDVLYLATGRPELAAGAEQWDADPLLLGTPRGTVDLRSGELYLANLDDYITRSTACGPARPGTPAPRWTAFLERILRHDRTLIPYLQRVAGYALTGLATEHALVFCWGTGANGKTTFWNVIKLLLGDYAHVAAPELLLQAGLDRHPTDMAALRGKRLVLMSELSAGQTWNEARLNRLTGGDPITARFMRQDEFTFDPSHTLVMFGNHKPALRTINEAARRRIQMMPFTQRIPPSEQVKGLDAALASAEGPAILRWIIDGCLAWQRQGLNPPGAVNAATEDYISAEDVLAEWIAERLEREWNGQPTLLMALYDSWHRWAHDRGYDARTSKWLGNELDERGYHRIRTRKGAGFEVTLVTVVSPIGS
jgi:putative DNA primase/helicase